MLTVVAANVADALGPGNLLRPAGATRQEVEALSWHFLEAGREIGAAEYLRAVTALRQFGYRLNEFQQPYDVLMTPTMAAPPPRLGELDPEREDFEAFNQAVQPFVVFTQMFNLSGQPAASLPLHWTPEGLPVGVQIAGRVGEEAVLLALAAQFERARPWFARRPHPAG